MSATYGGVEISKITKVTFSGSSDPIVTFFPKCKGALIKPSGKTSAQIKLNCSWHIAGKTKTEIEAYHHDLNEYMATSGEDLVVNGNTYVGLVPTGVDVENTIHNEYFVYGISFELNETPQNFFNSQVDSKQVRSGWFNYEYGDITEQISTFNFPILHNWEAALSSEFNVKENVRSTLDGFPTKEQAAGVENIALQCWAVNEPLAQLEAYIFNYMANCGPLGKKGTLDLNGNIYENAVMTSIESETPTGGNGSNSVKYTLGFKVSLQC